MIARALLVLALAAPPAAKSQSSEVCPWLNVGTAAKVLGSGVTATAHSDSNWSGYCRFVVATDSAASIDITVGKTHTHPCASEATPLTGIGNQAVLCSSRDTTGRTVQTVSGRVRDAWFVVVLARPTDKSETSSSQNKSAPSSEISFLAEQIAGNLY